MGLAKAGPQPFRLSQPNIDCGPADFPVFFSFVLLLSVYIHLERRDSGSRALVPDSICGSTPVLSVRSFAGATNFNNQALFPGQNRPRSSYSLEFTVQAFSRSFVSRFLLHARRDDLQSRRTVEPTG